MEGERTFSYASLGYVRHPGIKNALAVDGETKWIIEKVFDPAVHGPGTAEIAKVLIAGRRERRADAEKSLAYEADFEYTKDNRRTVGTGGNGE